MGNVKLKNKHGVDTIFYDVENVYIPSAEGSGYELYSAGSSGGTGTIFISANGTYGVTTYAEAQVAVPNTYLQSEIGHVVDNNLTLVSQSSLAIPTNGNYDTTYINNITVNVSGSLSSADIGKVVTPELSLSSQSSITVIANGTYNTTYNNEVTVDMLPGGQVIKDGQSLEWLTVNPQMITTDQMDQFLALLDTAGQYDQFDSRFQMYYCILGLNLTAYKLPTSGGFNGGYVILWTQNSSHFAYSTVKFDASSIIPGFICDIPGWQMTCFHYDPAITVNFSNINSYFLQALNSAGALGHSAFPLPTLFGPTSMQPNQINMFGGDSFQTIYINTKYNPLGFLSLLPYEQQTAGGITAYVFPLAFTDSDTTLPQLVALDLSQSQLANSGYAIYWLKVNPDTGDIDKLDVLYSSETWSIPGLVDVTTTGWQMESYTPYNYPVEIAAADGITNWRFWNVAHLMFSKIPILFGYEGGYTTQTITGTLDNTFGNYFNDFYTAYTQGKAQAIVVIDPSALSMPQVQGIVWGNITNGANLASGMAFDVSWDSGNGSLVAAQVLQSGTVVDITSYASVITTTLMIMWLY